MGKHTLSSFDSFREILSTLIQSFDVSPLNSLSNALVLTHFYIKLQDTVRATVRAKREAFTYSNIMFLKRKYTIKVGASESPPL